MSRLLHTCIAAGFFMLILALSSVSAPVALADTPTPQPCVPVKEAIEKGLVQASFTANGGLFFQEAIDYSLTNNSKSSLNLCISTGLVMESDEDYQDLLVGRSVTVNLRAGESKKGKLSVFCMNIDRHAPDSGIAYAVKGMAEENLLKVAQVIEKRKANGRLGAQLAVWNQTDGFSLEGLEQGLADLASGAEGEETNPIAVIRPLLSLASGELRLGQDILDEAAPGARLYTSDLPSGRLTDIPGIGEIPGVREIQGVIDTWDSLSRGYERARSLGPIAVVVVPLLCCVLPLAGIVSVVMLRRR